VTVVAGKLAEGEGSGGVEVMAGPQDDTSRQTNAMMENIRFLAFINSSYYYKRSYFHHIRDTTHNVISLYNDF
jgi:hypothetical protein